MNREPARVLVVDDDAEFRQQVASLLAEAGCLVTCAAGGRQAAHLLRNAETPDVIICDLHMPGIDGFALLETIRACPEVQHTPVIFVSGDDRNRIPSLERGGNDFLLKPIDPRELRARLRCQLRVSRTSRAWQQRSFLDPLTGLLNRRGFANQFTREVDRATRHHTSLAVVFLDLDGFKNVNDRLGHQVGDEILQQFARILEQSLRGSDLAVRWGGDEFVLGLPGSDRAAAARVAQRVRSSTRAAFAGLPLPLDVSAGIACLFEDACGTGERVVNALTRSADLAMYRDKQRHNRSPRYIARGSNPGLDPQQIRHERLAPLASPGLSPKPVDGRTGRQTDEWHPSRSFAARHNKTRPG